MANEITQDNDNNNTDKDSTLPPMDWVWKGYTAWHLHGIMAPKSDRLGLFESGKYLSNFYTTFYIYFSQKLWFHIDDKLKEDVKSQKKR